MLDDITIAVSYITDDILFMVNRTGQKKLSYVGKEKFFASIGNFKFAFEEFTADILWVVEEDKAVQIISPKYCKNNDRYQNLIIIYKAMDNKIKSIKLYESDAIPKEYQFVLSNTK